MFYIVRRRYVQGDIVAFSPVVPVDTIEGPFPSSEEAAQVARAIWGRGLWRVVAADDPEAARQRVDFSPTPFSRRFAGMLSRFRTRPWRSR